MNKSILVINTPDGCRECPLCGEDHMTYRDYCRITDSYIWTLDRPNWCPLKPVPKKYDINTAIIQNFDDDGDYELGWNQCIDEFLNK